MNISNCLTFAAYTLSFLSGSNGLVYPNSNVANNKTIRKCDFIKAENMDFPKWTCRDVNISEVNTKPLPTPKSWANMRD